MRLTLKDLYEVELDWGYGTAAHLGDTDRGRLDRAVVGVANELELDMREFEIWLRSKWGRWLVDGVHGCDESPTRATVRKYMRSDVVGDLLSEVLSSEVF